MEFTKPHKETITIYSKSGCNYCVKVKKLLDEKKYEFMVIDCDEFILENKEEFLLFIKETIGQEYNFFPMVFDNGVFIGGYNETVKYLENLELNFNEQF